MARCHYCPDPAEMFGKLNGRPVQTCAVHCSDLVRYAAKYSHTLQMSPKNVNTLTNQQSAPINTIPAEAGALATMDDMETIARRYELAATIAAGMSAASLLPAHLRTKKVEGIIVPLEPDEIRANCALIVNQALRWGVDPFALAPESFVIDGKLSYQGKLVAAIINRLAGLRENLRFDFTGSGDQLTVTVTGHLRTEPDPRTVTMTAAQGRAGSPDPGGMWTTDPEQKLCYSGAIRWARRHKPETLLGIVDGDEDGPAAVEPRMAPPNRIVDALQAKESYMGRIAAAPDRAVLNRAVDDLKTDGRLTAGETGTLVDLAKKRWVELNPVQPRPQAEDQDLNQDPPHDPDDQNQDPVDTPHGRWDRTIRTTPLNMLAPIMEEIIGDHELDAIEKGQLQTLADDLTMAATRDQS